ncbi:hypothetical protein [Thermogemmatispora tikiterensis]|uniref:Uncharacterized protein n=1 Tax=Thermogemmatispora tikiterensis TaxID=1825093 RepID=A0A328VE11_9CHLR|nr:hypothetical protein [Thermogemmatispora tikiterensis]RAQ95061.1 hypothetical protein A4R35_05900 [Thermogemmatispora tikiterensis]
MRAAAVAFVLVAAAAVVLWFGNTLNSWVLGGLIGGLAALLLSIPISLSLFSFLSRRHDEYFRAELQAHMALETAHQSPPPAPPRAVHQALLAGGGWRGPTRYTRLDGDGGPLAGEDEWVVAEGEEETDSNSGFVTFDDEEPEEEMARGRESASNPLSSRLSRSLSQELPARSPSSVPLQTRSTGRYSSALHPQTRIEGRRAQLQQGGYRLPPAAAGPAYPGVARAQNGSQRRQSQYFAEALRTARLEALRRQEETLNEENVEISPMLPPPPPRLAARRSSGLTGQMPASPSFSALSASVQQRQLRSQSLARSEGPVGPVSTTLSQAAGRRSPLATEADEAYDDDSLSALKTGNSAFARSPSAETDSGPGRVRAAGEQRLLRSSPSGSLRNPLVRRPPYLYEDDPLRTELSQFAEEPITRRSSRLRRFQVPDED